MKKLLKNQRGLTLVELLAVIVILGIVAAIAVPAIGGVIKKAETDSKESSIQMIEEAANLYLLANPDATTISVATLVSDKYLRETPKEPGKTTDLAVTITITDGVASVAEATTP